MAGPTLGLLDDWLDRNLRRVPRQLSVLGAVHVAHIRGCGGVTSNQIMIQEGGMMKLLGQDWGEGIYGG